VAAFSGVYLNYGDAGSSNSIGIIHGLLVSFDYAKSGLTTQFMQCSFEEARFACSGGAYQIQRQDVFGFEVTAVPFCQKLVFLKDIEFELQHGLGVWGMGMLHTFTVVVVMPMPMSMSMAMSVAVAVAASFAVVVVMRWVVVMFFTSDMNMVYFAYELNGNSVGWLATSAGSAHGV